jgi:SAM-dependent methyltransferase
LRDAWESEARNWIEWARAPGHDSYWRFHRDAFLRLLPPPGRLTVDLGCGEGRLPRDLQARGYRVIGIDGSPTMIAAARELDPEGEYRVADAASIPLEDASADLVLAFMTLQDFDDMEGAVREAARVLEPGGHFCIAVVHPINSAGRFAAHEPNSDFVIQGSYFQRRRERETFERDGHVLTFNSEHRPLEAYFAALESAGFVVDRLREIPDGTAPPGDRWSRVPLFLQMRALKPLPG